MLIDIPIIPNKQCSMTNPAIIAITNNEIPKVKETMTTIMFALSSNCMSIQIDFQLLSLSTYSRVFLFEFLEQKPICF